MPGVSHLPRGGCGGVQGFFSPVRMYNPENTIKALGSDLLRGAFPLGLRLSPEPICSERWEIWS